MKSTIVLAALFALASADLASAANVHAHRHVQRRAVRPVVKRHAPPPVVVRHHFSALALQAQKEQRARAAAEAANSGSGVRFIKEDGRAGWGVKDGRTETIVGAYRRPPDPNLPAPKMFNESRGAAGVQLSIGLGH